MMRSGSAAHIILPCFLAHGSGRDIPKVLAERNILVLSELANLVLNECRLNVCIIKTKICGFSGQRVGVICELRCKMGLH